MTPPHGPTRALKVAGGAATMLLLLAGSSFGCWWLIGIGDRQVSGIVDPLAKAARLQQTTAESSIWTQFRNDNSKRVFARWPVAQGQRRGFPVELSASGGAKDRAALTWVVVAGSKQIVEAPAGIARMSMYTFTASPGLRPANADWFPDGGLWGSPADVARAFPPAVATRLRGFPRELAVVALEARVIVIQWFGAESDPAMVERAFDLAIECLQLLSPR